MSSLLAMAIMENGDSYFYPVDLKKKINQSCNVLNIKGFRGQYKIIIVKISQHKVSSLRATSWYYYQYSNPPDIFWWFLLYLGCDVKSNDNKLPKLGDYLNFIDLIYLSNQINKNHFLSWGSISASNGANLVWTNQFIKLNT